jgi:pimeloyl-ACP methyl ester carboxylesterase
MLKFQQKPSFMPRPISKRNNRKQQPAQVEVVDPAWLLKALAVTVLGALLCAYLTFCLLFYQGQWQLVLHPARTSTSPQSIAGVPYDLIHFGPDESAVPQLTGWWIPSAHGGRYADTTLLFLPGSDGSLADSIPTLGSLHNLGINVFAFDYRGYGQSSPTRPNQKNMTHDAESAWTYLNISRHIPAQQIVLYGTGVGASLATQLAASHASAALILDAPHADLLDTALQDHRSSLVPVRLLFHERFPLAEPLSTLHTPKLLLSRALSPDKAFRTAADPKLTVELVAPSAALYQQSLTRFLDEYVAPAPLPQLVPSPTPSPTIPR